MIILHKLNVGIELHCITSDKSPLPDHLTEICSSIHLYPCVQTKFPWFKALNEPIAVNTELEAAIGSDDHPLLLESISLVKMLGESSMDNRRVVVRVQPGEACQLKEFNKELWYACECRKDAETIAASVGHDQVAYLPVFSPWQDILCETGTGNLCLYHGDLSNPDNEQAATWLLQKVFTKIKIPFVIAGNAPSRRLEKQAHFCQHTCMVRDPSQSEMDDLVRKAHIHVLPSFRKEVRGTSVKLIHSLHEGRHCIANDAMVEGTGLEEACHIGTTANAFASIILQLFHQPFPVEEITLRKRLFATTYNNEVNARKLIQWLW